VPNGASVFDCTPRGGKDFVPIRGTGAISTEVLMGPSLSMSEYDRLMRYGGRDVMSTFQSQNSSKDQCDRVIRMLRDEPSPAQKIFLRYEYLKSSILQVQSIALNGSLRSTSMLYTNRYLQEAGNFPCKGMKRLFSGMLGPHAASHLKVCQSPRPWRCNTELCDYASPVRWKIAQPDAFLYHSFIEEDLYRLNNRKYNILSPLNEKVGVVTPCRSYYIECPL